MLTDSPQSFNNITSDSSLLHDMDLLKNISPIDNFDSMFSPNSSYLNNQNNDISMSSSMNNLSQKNYQTFHFIDQTPQHTKNSNIKPQNMGPLEKVIDVEKSRIAQQRRRDRRGKFIRNEVATRLEDLEQQLEAKERMCDSLRNTLNKKDLELEQLKQQFQQIITQRSQMGYFHNPPQFVQVPPSLCTTNRNYTLEPIPNPSVIHNRKPFMEKIDYTKVPLRKTEQLDEEKREVISSQTEWEENQRLKEFILKAQQQAQWQALQFQPYQPNCAQSYYGGAPSNIYPETLNKVGNLPVNAFTTKVDLTSKREKLAKKQDSSLEKLLQADQNDYSEVNQMRLSNSSDDLFQRLLRSVDSPSQFNDDISNWDDNDIIMNSTISPNISSNDNDNDNYNINSNDIEMNISPRRLLGGPPSNIYPPPEKIGNLQVPAFTTKIDYSEIPLRKTDGY